jgi:putative SOS response-associated peptidase YedK
VCGRYFLHSNLDALTELFGELHSDVELDARFNIAPSQDVPVVHCNVVGEKWLSMMRWGLVPPWSSAINSRYSMINARAETVAEKPAYRRAFRQQRCLIPADGIYEWKATSNGKQPYAIFQKDKKPFAMAGIWESWKSPDGPIVESCSIIVTAANNKLVSIHDRMPVILSPEEFTNWLDKRITKPELLQPLLNSYPSEAMDFYPVSRRVNNAREDDSALIDQETHSL